jgi:hypothetical protein
MFAKYPKIANPNDFFFEIIDSLNRNTKLIINTKINIMKTNFLKLSLSAVFIFSSSVFAQVDGPILNGVDNTSEYKTIELINMDKDLSVFANLLTLSGHSLALTTEPHTLLVPTNEAFSKMSIKRFAELTN